MKKILITGSNGFIGKNLQIALKRQNNIEILTFDQDDSKDMLEEYLDKAEFIVHLAGVNRPKSDMEFTVVNYDLTKLIIDKLIEMKKKTPIIFSSSTQAEQDNPYGISKRRAEQVIEDYSKITGAMKYIYRLTNIFGKWSRPNYNSVVATFCYNISHNIDIKISDRNNIVELVYIDDVVQEFVSVINDVKEKMNVGILSVNPTYRASLGDLADKIYSFKKIRENSVLPDLSDNFIRYLYATYLSFHSKANFSYPVKMMKDERGWLFELIKSRGFGQIFISETNPGYTRGKHYHDTKVEKFCVVQGKGIIKFRKYLTDEIISYEVTDNPIVIVDIPPGYTHSIENIGGARMVTVFWASEIFNPQIPDAYYEEI